MPTKEDVAMIKKEEAEINKRLKNEPQEDKKENAS
jgi:hypothetical protein